MKHFNIHLVTFLMCVRWACDLLREGTYDNFKIVNNVDDLTGLFNRYYLKDDKDGMEKVIDSFLSFIYTITDPETYT